MKRPFTAGWPLAGQRNDEALGRLAHAFDIEDDRLDDAGFDRGDAIEGGDVRLQRLGGAHGGGEDIGEAVALVVGGAGFVERAIGADGEDERGDAGTP